MILVVHIGEQVMARLLEERFKEGEGAVLDPRFFLRDCLVYLRSRGAGPAQLDGILLLSGAAKFSLSRQVATALNTLAFAYGTKIAGIRSSSFDQASVARGLRVLHRAHPGMSTLPWYVGAPHITKPKKIMRRENI